MAKDFVPNKEQEEVIDHKDGPLLVLAGPGSGKTLTIVHRVAKLKEKGADPKKILCITFTQKATEVMKSRLESLEISEATVSTFHSFCKDVCSENFMTSGLSDSSKLMKETSLAVWCLKNFDTFGIDYKIIGTGDGLPRIVKGMVQALSNFKESLITSEQFQKWLNEQEKRFEKFDPKEIRANKELIKYVILHKEFNKVYAAYEKFQQDKEIFDFDDMVLRAVTLLREEPDILEEYQKKYDYILVDEFQDNNFSQFELVRMLGAHGNIMVVGDDDQLIYRFQGAREESFDEFLSDFKNVTVKTLGENYRCTEKIVEASKLILENIPNRKDKTLSAKQSGGEKTKIIRADTDKGQVEYVVNKIAELVGTEYENIDGETKKYTYGDFAILTRQRHFGDKFVNGLNVRGIPSTHIGDFNIFETAIISELMLYLRVLEAPSKAGMYLDKLMTASGISAINISVINHTARDDDRYRHVLKGSDDGVFEVMKNCDTLDITQKSEIKNIVKNIENAEEFASKSTVAELVYHLIYSDATGLYKRSLLVDSFENKLNILLLNTFYDLTKEYQTLNPDETYKQYLEYLDLLRKVEIDIEEKFDVSDTVHVMTMHKTKGKEYPVVFIGDVANEKFPGKDITRTFYVHDELLKGTTSLSFDSKTRMQDERRLFYVAVTRAQNLLYIMAPKLYEGNKNEKKVSEFLTEISQELRDGQKDELFTVEPYQDQGSLKFNPKELHERIKYETQIQAIDSINRMQLETAINRIIELGRIAYLEEHRTDDPGCKNFDPLTVLNVNLKDVNLNQELIGKPLPLYDPNDFSVSKSSLETYAKCPYKFQLSKVLRTPSPGTVYTNLGNSIHEMIEGTADKSGKVPTRDEALAKLKEKWIWNSYSSKTGESEFKARAEKMTDVYLEWRNNNKNKFIASEKQISIKYEGLILNGKIDWLEENPDGEFEVVDFKTSKTVTSQNKAEEDWQLHIYAWLVWKEFGKIPAKASLFFLEKGKMVTIEIDKDKVENLLDSEIKPIIEKILKNDFKATPEGYKCSQCEYQGVCSEKV